MTCKPWSRREVDALGRRPALLSRSIAFAFLKGEDVAARRRGRISNPIFACAAHLDKMACCGTRAARNANYAYRSDRADLLAFIQQRDANRQIVRLGIAMPGFAVDHEWRSKLDKPYLSRGVGSRMCSNRSPLYWILAPNRQNGMTTIKTQ